MIILFFTSTISFQFGRQFLSQLSRCILMINNTKEIFYAIYSLINIVTFEANDQDTLVDFIHFSLKIQVDHSTDHSFLSMLISVRNHSINPNGLLLHPCPDRSLFEFNVQTVQNCGFLRSCRSSKFPSEFIGEFPHVFRSFMLVKTMLRTFFHQMLFVIYPPQIRIEPSRTIVSFPKR